MKSATAQTTAAIVSPPLSLTPSNVDMDRSISSKNGDGSQGEVLQCRAPSQMVMELERIVLNPATPYDSVSAFMRQAVQYHIENVRRISGTPSTAAAFEQLSEMAGEDRMQGAMFHACADVEHRVVELVGEKRHGRAKYFILAALGRIRSLKDEYWSEAAEEELLRRVGKYLHDAEPAIAPVGKDKVKVGAKTRRKRKAKKPIGFAILDWEALP